MNVADLPVWEMLRWIDTKFDGNLYAKASQYDPKVTVLDCALKPT